MGRIGKKTGYRFCAVLFALTLSLTGCGNQSAAGNGSEGSAVTAKTTSTSNADTKNTSKEIPNELLPSGRADSGNDSSVTGSTSTSTFDAGGGTTSQSAAGSAPESAGSSETASNSGGTSDSSTENSSNPETVRVTMSIDGSAANSYGYSVSLSAVSLTVKAGSSVYDALVASGVAFSGSGGYVAGIEGLYEFDCGKMSGWKYSVNGVEPTTGSTNYICSEGDSIVWTYVLSY